MPRDDDLPGPVDVRKADDLALRRTLAHGLERGAIEAQDRSHRASALRHGFLHETAALANRGDRFLERKGPRGHVCRVLAEAVAGRGRRLRAAPRRERPVGGDRNREDRRLRDLGSNELGLGPRETELRQPHVQRVVGGAEDGRGRRLSGRKVLSHPRVLRSLTWKQRRERPHQRTALAAQVRPAPKAAIRMTSPRAILPARTASSSAIGIEAADVFPYRSMLT